MNMWTKEELEKTYELIYQKASIDKNFKNLALEYPEKAIQRITGNEVWENPKLMIITTDNEFDEISVFSPIAEKQSQMGWWNVFKAKNNDSLNDSRSYSKMINSSFSTIKPSIKWSKYNLQLQSKSGVNLLYNSLSNTLVQMDDRICKELEAIKNNAETYDYTQKPSLYIQLRMMKILVKNGEEEEIIDQMELKRLFTNYDTDSLALTIAPTRACNFNCTYCYEKFRPNISMTEETEDKIISFIKKFGKLQFLTIDWYGGEPTLKFDTICRLTEKIKQLKIPFSASMITNGYLLDEEKIVKLNDLKIKKLQITLDGPPEIHDQRRMLVSGGKTYEIIINNMEKLFENWDGTVDLRVNMDKSNEDDYFQHQKVLMEKFKGKNIFIYPGIVHSSNDTNPDVGCQFNKDDAIDFYIRQFNNKSIDISHTPQSIRPGGCIATKRNGFIIGPQGELYKCWNDLGLEDRIVGSVYPDKPWNNRLLTRYMVGTNKYNYEKCRECFYFPICKGQCAYFRIQEKYFDKKINICTFLKNRLPQLLKLYYEHYQRNKVDNYYSNQTEKFYINMWDDEHIHFGIFDEDCRLHDLVSGTAESKAALKKAVIKMIEAVVEPVQIKSDDLVVDAGCGIGGTAIYIAKKFNCFVNGLNICKEQIEMASEKVKEAKLEDKITIRYADCSTLLPFEDNSVDVIINIESACHYANRKKFISECYRVLKPGGKLVAQDWIAKDKISKEHYIKYIQPICDTWFLSGLETISTYSALFEEAGFEIVEIESLDEGTYMNAELMKIGNNMLLRDQKNGKKLTKTQLMWLDQFKAVYEAWSKGYFGVGRYLVKKK